MKKIAWVNIMKGIGILAVVAGHIYDGDLKRMIFMFHMPLFFFLSGYLFNPKHNIKEYFFKKGINLLLPYIAFLILIYFPSLIDKSNLSFFDIVIRPIMGGRFLINETGVFWFVTVLFATQQIMNVMIVKISNKYLIYFIILFLIISYINSIFYPKIWLPLNLNVVFASLPIFYIGYLLKKEDMKIPKFLLLVGSLIVIFSIVYLPQNTYDMKYSLYGIPILTFVSGIIITINIKQISVVISRISFLNSFFSVLGNASLVIMFLHIPFQLLIKKFITPNCTIRFIGATIISYIFYLIFNKNMYLRAVFLGSKTDFDKIKQKISNKGKNSLEK